MTTWRIYWVLKGESKVEADTEDEAREMAMAGEHSGIEVISEDMDHMEEWE